MEVTLARKEDWPALAAIKAAVHAEHSLGGFRADAWAAMWAKACLAELGAVFVARAPYPVGFIAGQIYFDDSSGETRGVVIAACLLPEFRGRRISTKLFESLEEWLAGKGCRRVITSYPVAAENFEGIARMFRRKGYAPLECSFHKEI